MAKSYWTPVAITGKGMYMKGYRNRAYMYNVPFYFDLGRTKRERMFLGAIAHVKDDDVLLEIIYRNGDLGEWSLPDSDEMERFYKDTIEGSVGGHFQETVECTSAKPLVRDNHCYIQINPQRQLNTHIAKFEGVGVKKETITYSILGDIVEDYGDWLSLMVRFPKNILYLSDAKAVRQAMLHISHSGPVIWSNFFPSEIEKEREVIEDLRKKKAKMEADFNKECEDAASALNELSDRFGIEIDMSLPNRELEEEDN